MNFLATTTSGVSFSHDISTIIVVPIAAGLFGIVILIIGIDLAIYLIGSIVDLFRIHHGGIGKVKHLTALTSWLDHYTPSAIRTRRMWKRDMENTP